MDSFFLSEKYIFLNEEKNLSKTKGESYDDKRTENKNRKGSL